MPAAPRYWRGFTPSPKANQGLFIYRLRPFICFVTPKKTPHQRWRVKDLKKSPRTQSFDQKVKVVFMMPPNTSSLPSSSMPKIAGVTVMLSLTAKL